MGLRSAFTDDLFVNMRRTKYNIYFIYYNYIHVETKNKNENN